MGQKSTVVGAHSVAMPLVAEAEPRFFWWGKRSGGHTNSNLRSHRPARAPACACARHCGSAGVGRGAVSVVAGKLGAGRPLRRSAAFNRPPAGVGDPNNMGVPPALPGWQ